MWKVGVGVGCWRMQHADISGEVRAEVGVLRGVWRKEDACRYLCGEVHTEPESTICPNLVKNAHFGAKIAIFFSAGLCPAPRQGSRPGPVEGWGGDPPDPPKVRSDMSTPP
eukprot:7128983-Prymnesium_polylepis.1